MISTFWKQALCFRILETDNSFPYFGNHIYFSVFWKPIKFLMMHYIFMADVIKSRNIPKKKQFIDQLDQLVKDINKKNPENILSPLTITLGDEFQAVIKSSNAVFQILFDIDQRIITEKLDISLRYSIVYGEIDTAINKKIAHKMYGQGLTDARKQLDLMKNDKKRYSIQIDESVDQMLNGLLYLYQSLIDQWKKSDFDKLAILFKSNDYHDLVRSKIYENRSGAWKSYQSLRFEEYMLLKQLILETLRNE